MHCGNDSVSKVLAMPLWGSKFNIQNPCLKKQTKTWWFNSPELERQRQADPAGFLTHQPSFLVYSKPVRDPVRKSRVDSFSRMMPEVNFWLTCPCVHVLTCKSTPRVNKHIPMHMQIFKSDRTGVNRSAQYGAPLKEDPLLLTTYVHRMQWFREINTALGLGSPGHLTVLTSSSSSLLNKKCIFFTSR